MGTSVPIVLENDIWEALDHLVAVSSLAIDRPKGSRHPRYPDIIYPVDYGYLEGKTTVDGGGLDVWAGTLPEKSLTSLVLTVDLLKRDVEIKLLLGCNAAEHEQILEFLNSDQMRAALILR